MEDDLRGCFSVKVPLRRALAHLLFTLRARSSTREFFRNMRDLRKDKDLRWRGILDLEVYGECIHKDIILPLQECLDGAKKIFDWIMKLEWKDYEVTQADYHKLCQIGIEIMGPPKRKIGNSSILDRLRTDVRKEKGFTVPPGSAARKESPKGKKHKKRNRVS